MFGIFKKKRKHKKVDFTKRRMINNEYEYYNPSLNQWLLWSNISSDTEFTNESELLNTTLLDLENPNTNTPRFDPIDEHMVSLGSSNNHSQNSAGYDGGFTHSSSSSSSSYDSCSSSSSFGSGDSGGCF